MPVQRLNFLFDFISPNAYLAWTQVHALAERHGYVVTSVPVLFAGLLGANRAQGPAEVRNKWRWMVRDIVRKARALAVPLEAPTSHPFNPLLALRLASLDLSDADRRRLIDVLFEAIWAGGPGVTDPQVVSRLLDAQGFDGASMVLAATADAVKARLRRQTDGAVEQRVFGVPTVLVSDRLFWGYDDFPHLDAFLAGDDRFDETVFTAWEAVRPTAVRKLGNLNPR